MSRVKIRGWAATALAATALSGCGESNGLVPVSGRVNYRGEPAAGATVSFVPTGPGEVARAEVGPDGSFRLGSGDLGAGARPGRYAVLVEWRQGPLRTHRRDAKRPAEKAIARANKPLLIADDRLKGRYFDPDHPRLSAEIQARGNSLPPFELVD